MAARKPRPMLVTGGTGCIGGRLVERLILERETPVRALVRDPARAIRLGRFDLTMVRGDAASAEDVARAVEGCGAVIHCAHSWDDPESNVAAAQALIGACLEHKVERLVFVSSLSVYEPLGNGVLDESAPRVPTGWSYPDNKLELEHVFEEAHRQEGLPVVVVEPTVVYGPHSVPWTLRPIELVRHSRIVLPDDGEGTCNAVYVDDVVDSLLLAVDSDRAVGERLLVSGPETVTWREFFRAYEEMTGVSSLTFVPAAGFEETGPATMRRDPRALLRPVLQSRGAAKARALLGRKLTRAVGSRIPERLAWPNEQELALYRARTRVSSERARSALGYEPRVQFEDGMALTADYVAWARL